MAVKLANAKDAQFRITSAEDRILNINPQGNKNKIVIKIRNIYVVKNVPLPKCIKGAFANCLKIDEKISFLFEGVNFVVV